MINFAANK